MGSNLPINILHFTFTLLYTFRLYLNGDGTGEGNHMSIYFVIMKSEYDHLLHWSFQKKVIFKLLNMNDKQLNHHKTVEPYKTSSNCEKPTNELNLVAGSSKFISLKDVDKFIFNDCLFLETLLTEHK